MRRRLSYAEEAALCLRASTPASPPCSIEPSGSTGAEASIPDRYNVPEFGLYDVPPGPGALRGRGQPKEFNEWVKLDLEYIDNWSLWLDLKILLQTIPYMLLGKNY